MAAVGGFGAGNVKTARHVHPLDPLAHTSDYHSIFIAAAMYQLPMNLLITYWPSDQLENDHH